VGPGPLWLNRGLSTDPRRACPAQSRAQGHVRGNLAVVPQTHEEFCHRCAPSQSRTVRRIIVRAPGKIKRRAGIAMGVDRMMPCAMTWIVLVTMTRDCLWTLQHAKPVAGTGHTIASGRNGLYYEDWRYHHVRSLKCVRFLVAQKKGDNPPGGRASRPGSRGRRTGPPWHGSTGNLRGRRRRGPGRVCGWRMSRARNWHDWFARMSLAVRGHAG
jgi:hypothetical protein